MQKTSPEIRERRRRDRVTDDQLCANKHWKEKRFGGSFYSAKGEEKKEEAVHQKRDRDAHPKN